MQLRLWYTFCVLVGIAGFAEKAIAAACPFSSASDQVRMECVAFEGHQYLVATIRMEAGVRIAISATNRHTSLKNMPLPQRSSVALITNAGIFADNPDGSASPQGLLIQDGIEKSKLNLQDFAGANVTNFYWKPNGVFWMDTSGKAHITESKEFSRVDLKNVSEATQSGPLLLQSGVIHPDPVTGKPSESFLASKSSYIRNGVGVGNDSGLFVVISLEAVRLGEFARLFRDKLLCTDALYLDGAISDMYLPQMNKAVIDRGDGAADIFVTFLAVTFGKQPGI